MHTHTSSATDNHVTLTFSHALYIIDVQKIGKKNEMLKMCKKNKNM